MIVELHNKANVSKCLVQYIYHTSVYKCSNTFMKLCMCIMCTCKAVQFFQLVNHKIENLSFFTIEYMIATENYPFLELSRHKNNTPYHLPLNFLYAPVTQMLR